MKRMSRGFLAFSVAALAAIGVAGGCGGPSGMPAGQAELSGLVTKNGKPLVGGGNVIYKIVFNPVGGTPASDRTLDAQLSEDGSYSITLPQGEYDARVMNAKSEPIGNQVKLIAKESLSRGDFDIEKKP